MAGRRAVFFGRLKGGAEFGAARDLARGMGQI
jgi:hypothetical protein